MKELLVQPFGEDKLVLYSPEPHTFHGFKREILFCLAYLEHGGDVVYSVNAEYFIERSLAVDAFRERANSKHPRERSSKFRPIEQFLQRA